MHRRASWHPLPQKPAPTPKLKPSGRVSASPTSPTSGKSTCSTPPICITVFSLPSVLWKDKCWPAPGGVAIHLPFVSQYPPFHKHYRQEHRFGISFHGITMKSGNAVTRNFRGNKFLVVSQIYFEKLIFVELLEKRLEFAVIRSPENCPGEIRPDYQIFRPSITTKHVWWINLSIFAAVGDFLRSTGIGVTRNFLNHRQPTAKRPSGKGPHQSTTKFVVRKCQDNCRHFRQFLFAQGQKATKIVKKRRDTLTLFDNLGADVGLPPAALWRVPPSPHCTGGPSFSQATALPSPPTPSLFPKPPSSSL